MGDVGKLDVKGAFMYAPLPPSMRVVVRPPRSCVRLGPVRDGTFWTLSKAVYGLRIAPRAWGTELESRGPHLPTRTVHRRLTSLEIVQVSGASVDHVTLGLLICYVDDLLLLSPRVAVRSSLTAAPASILQIT